MTRRRAKWWLGFLALAAFIVAARSVVVVDQTEAVHVTEFGRTVRLIGEPGLYFKWPHQSARGYDRRLQLDTPPPRRLRADPERAAAGRRGDAGRRREPGPYDPERGRPGACPHAGRGRGRRRPRRRRGRGRRRPRRQRGARRRPVVLPVPQDAGD